MTSKIPRNDSRRGDLVDLVCLVHLVGERNKPTKLASLLLSSREASTGQQSSPGIARVRMRLDDGMDQADLKK